MKAFSKSLVVMASVTAMVACSPNKDKDAKNSVTTLNSAAIAADKTLSPVNKAEKLALAGEQLITPTGFMYADLVFDQALSFDANNKRAKFYKAILATHMSFRGILARIKPLAYSTAKTKKDYDTEIANFPNGGLKDFLLDGTGDIKNEKDVQKFMDDVYAAQNSTRTFLKNNKSMELTLNLSEWAYNQRVEKFIEQCWVTAVENGTYEIKNCDLSNLTQIDINRADIEVLQQMSAGMQIYLATLVSYDATGAIATARKYENKTATNKVLYKELAQNADFAKLRNANALKDIIALGADAVAGVRWAVQIQNELCPEGQETIKNREGFLFEKGLCVSSENEDGTQLEDILRVADTILAGQVIEVNVGKEEKFKATAKPAAVLSDPIPDLKALRPVFNNCDKVQSVSDDTLGGIFPNHDANEVLGAESQCEYWY